MGEGELASLQALRDACRDPAAIPDVETLLQLLSAALSDLGIHPSASIQSAPAKPASKRFERLLPAIQSSLLCSIYPTFRDSLNDGQLELLETFFVPLLKPDGLHTRRTVALIAYQTLSSLFSTSHPQSNDLPPDSQDFALGIAARVSQQYGINHLYWAVFGGNDKLEEGSRDASMRNLRWEETLKSFLSLPAKAANAAGKWRAEGWSGNLPGALRSRKVSPQFHLEALVYELSQGPHTSVIGAIRLVFERLIALRLLGSTCPPKDDPKPSVLSAMFPSLLLHLHPSLSTGLPGYPPGFLPQIFLSLSTTALYTVTSALVQHLCFHLGSMARDPSPDERIKRAAIVLDGVIGPAASNKDAYEAVRRYLLHGSSRESSRVGARAVEIRVMTTWVSRGGEKLMRNLIESLLDTWTSPKYIKFALFTEQYHLTSAVLLAVSFYPRYSPYLKSLSHRSSLITSMQSYLSHPDPSIRRLGMLVAEILSELTIPASVHDEPSEADDDTEAMKAELEKGDGEEIRAAKPKGIKRLKFKGMWDGVGEGREECQALRNMVGVVDNEAVLQDHRDGSEWLLGWEEDRTTTSAVVADVPLGTVRPIRPTHTPPATRGTKPRQPPPKIVMLDEDQSADPLSGYGSPSPSSSRSPSPTQGYLDEVIADPSLALDSVAKKKITRPVYIQQLWALLKEREKPEEIEVALQWGEGLVRSKRNFGRELEEYAENVANMAIALNSSFNIENFEEKRQGLLNALVSCAPRQVAPSLCESYFTGHYSLQQRSVMLTALAIGARELAGLPTIQSATYNRQIDFPTKTLPPKLHRKYISAADVEPESSHRHPDQLEAAISGVRDLMLSKGAKRAEAEPEIAREKRLRLGRTRDKRTMVAEVGSMQERQMSSPRTSIAQLPRTSEAVRPVVPFKDVAAEYFIMPLINRFWSHWHDSSAREARSTAAGSGYRGAGTGMLLSPMAMEKLITTLALLLHAARHSAAFLHVLAPESLELALTVGSRHISRPDAFEHESSLPSDRAEASVLGASLELALICLDTSFDLDTGRTFAMDHSALLLASGEWAQAVFETEEKGGAVASGQGGMREGRVRMAAAGVVVKVAEIGQKWTHLRLLR